MLSANEVNTGNKNSVTVQVKFANYQLAADARQKFNGQQADGRILEVVILESSATASASLLRRALASGIAAPKGAEFDLLPDSGSSVGGLLVIILNFIFNYMRFVTLIFFPTLIQPIRRIAWRCSGTDTNSATSHIDCQSAWPSCR